MRTRRSLLLAAFGTLAFAPFAWANAGTPLMWASALHLVFGNAVIGVGEGLLLARVSCVARRKSVPVMILANYFSAWLGVWAFSKTLEFRLPIDLNNGLRWLWVMIVLTYLATILLEWPFVAWCVRGRQDWFRQSVRASVIVQSASYIVLFGWYGLASSTSVYAKTHIVAPSQISLPGEVMVYYIAPDDGAVYSRPLVGGTPRKVLELNSTSHDDRPFQGDSLFVRKNRANAGTWDIVALLLTEDYKNPKSVIVRENLSLDATPRLPNERANSHNDEERLFIFGKAPTLGANADSPWEFYAGFWAAEGLEAKNTKTGEQIHFTYETPFSRWLVRHPVVLPSGQLLFQFGRDQICVFDPATKQLALLWRGRGPVAVIEQAHAGQ